VTCAGDCICPITRLRNCVCWSSLRCSDVNPPRRSPPFDSSRKESVRLSPGTSAREPGVGIFEHGARVASPVRAWPQLLRFAASGPSPLFQYARERERHRLLSSFPKVTGRVRRAKCLSINRRFHAGSATTREAARRNRISAELGATVRASSIRAVVSAGSGVDLAGRRGQVEHRGSRSRP
jgi:hypothetical protein